MQIPIPQALDALATASGLSTQTNKMLPAAPPVPAIPSRVGAGMPKKT
jgi:hypothetical protein